MQLRRRDRRRKGVRKGSGIKCGGEETRARGGGDSAGVGSLFTNLRDLVHSVPLGVGCFHISPGPRQHLCRVQLPIPGPGSHFNALLIWYYCQGLERR
eukprot:412358-Rhodomonas_salina.1